MGVGIVIGDIIIFAANEVKLQKIVFADTVIDVITAPEKINSTSKWRIF